MLQTILASILSLKRMLVSFCINFFNTIEVCTYVVVEEILIAKERSDNLKAVILCGGKGLRMKEVTDGIPKPLAMIGNKPMLWHIMKTYYHYGFKEFVLLLGYKGDQIKEYFKDYKWKNSDFILSEDGSYKIIDPAERWKITFLDTGLETMTGGRLLRAKTFLKDESFMLT